MQRTKSPGKVLMFFRQLREQKLRCKPKPTSWPIDRAKIGRMLKDYPEVEVMGRMEAYFEDNDPYLRRNCYTLGLFLYRFDSYAKSVVSQARAEVEAKKKRDALNEDPGANREQHKSDPTEIGELMKKLLRRTE